MPQFYLRQVATLHTHFYCTFTQSSGAYMQAVTYLHATLSSYSIPPSSTNKTFIPTLPSSHTHTVPRQKSRWEERRQPEILFCRNFLTVKFYAKILSQLPFLKFTFWEIYFLRFLNYLLHFFSKCMLDVIALFSIIVITSRKLKDYIITPRI